MSANVVASDDSDPRPELRLERIHVPAVSGHHQCANADVCTDIQGDRPMPPRKDSLDDIQTQPIERMDMQAILAGGGPAM
jgi:hypothetical protein